MERNLVWTISVAFLLFSIFENQEGARADDTAKNIEEMKAAMKAQAAEIEKLKKEREGQKQDDKQKAKEPESFWYKDGRQYIFDQNAGVYCFLNEYGLKRCMQNWEVKTLACSEAEDGKVQCR